MEIKTTTYNGQQLEISKKESRRFCNQEIGVKDKNGIPIREGSIIICDYYRYPELNPEVVIYRDDECGFGFDDICTTSFAHEWGEGVETRPDQWEVVGSIYDER